MEVTESDENNVEKDTPVAMAGLINEEVQAGGQRQEEATYEERELENIYRALDAIFAEEPGGTAQEKQELKDIHRPLDEILAVESEETAQEKRELEDIHRALEKRPGAPIIRVSHSSLRP